MPGKTEIDLIVHGEEARAEVAKTDVAFDNLGKAGQSGANQAKAGLNNLEKAARSSAQAVTSSGSQAKAAIEGWGGAASSAASRFRPLVETTDQASGGFGRMTSMINTGQGALRGYDAIIQGVVRSLGGIAFGWAIAIQLASAFIPKLIELASGKSENLKLDKEQVELDLVRARTLTTTIGSLGEYSTAQASVNRANADLVIAFRILTNEQSDFERSNRDLNRGMINLASNGALVRRGFNETGEEIDDATVPVKVFVNEIAQFNTEISESEKNMQPALEALRQARDLYHLNTDQLLLFAQNMNLVDSATEEGAKTLGFFRDRLDEDIPRLKAISAALKEGAESATQMERDLLQLDIRLQSLTVPKFNLAGTSEGVDAMQAAVLNALHTAEQKGLAGTEATRFIEPTVRPLIETLKKAATSVAEYHHSIRVLNIAVREQVEATLAMDKANKDAFATEKKGVDLLALKKEVRTAEIKAMRDGVSAEMQALLERERLIKLDFQTRRDELVKNGQMTELISDQLHTIEQFQLADLSRQRIAQMEKELATTERLRRESLGRQFDTTVSIMRQMADAISVAGRSAEGETGPKLPTGLLPGISDPAPLDKRIAQLIKLKTTAKDVENVFGSTSTTMEQFDARLASMAAEGASAFTTMGQLTRDFGKDLIQTGQLFQILGNTIAGVFEQSISGQESFGKALLKGFLSAIAQIATMLGNLFLLAAAGLAFIPGLNWTAGPLIAAGLGLLAFAGILQGLSSRIGADKTAAGSAAAGGSTAAAAGGAQPVPRSPTVIPFPTSGSGSRNGATVVNVSLDRQGTSDFLDGRQVVTLPKARGSQNRVLRKALAS